MRGFFSGIWINLTKWDTCPQSHRDAFEAWLLQPMEFRLEGYLSLVCK